MITPVLDTDILKVLTVFASSPGSRFRRKELKELTRLSNVPLDGALARLLSAGVVARERSLYAVEHGSEDARRLIELARAQHRHLRDIPFAAYFAVLDALRAISALRGVEAYLFGSYAKLVYDERSDVDIAVVAPKPPAPSVLRRIEERVERSSGVRVELHAFARRELEANRKDPLVRDIVRNGVRLL